MRFQRFFLVFLMFSIVWQGQAQAGALPAATRVGTAVAGVIEQQLIRRGFAANDPRFQATLNVVGIAANDAVFNVAGTTGMVVAGVAGLPAWATVAIGLGVGALAFGAYKLLTQPVSVTDPVTGQTTQKYAVAPVDASVADIQAAAANPLPAVTSPNPSALTNLTPSQYAQPISVVFPYVQMMDPMSCAQYYECSSRPAGKSYPYYIGDSSNGYAAVPVSTFGDFNAYVNYKVGQLTATGDDGNPNAPVAMGHVENLNIVLQGGQIVASGTLRYDWQWTGGYDANGNKTYQPRTDGYYSAINWSAQSNPFFVAPPQTGTLDELLTKLAIDAAAANSAISAQSLADITNAAWRNAAARPDYQGFPYSLTDPVSPTDAQNWQMQNPMSQPTLNDALQPITGPVTVPNPYTTTTPDPGTTTNPTVKVDLGPDPGIGAPGLADIPTAASILAPLLNLFPDLRSYVVPSHSAECPKPSMELWGKTLTLQGHCDLLDSPAVRQTLYLIMAAVWVMVALFIVLAA